MNLRLGLSLKDEAKLQAIIVATRLFSGDPPIVERFEDHVQVDFTPEQQLLMQDVLKGWHDAEPGPIRLNIRPVLISFYLKRYGALIALLTAGGILLGSVLMKRR